MTDRMRVELVLVLSVCGCASSVSGQVQGFYFATNEYDVSYDRSLLPDFDQVRDFSEETPALPNAGRMYCAPTSMTNLFGYLANTRTPFLRPFPEDWSQYTLGTGWFPYKIDKYNEITETVRDVGILMSTTPDNGTKAVNQKAGAEQWLTQWSTAADLRNVFEVYLWGPDGSDWTDNNITTVKPAEMAQYLWRGDVITAFWGYYAVDEEEKILLERNGGHVITPYRVDRNDPTTVARMEYRNPSSGSGDTVVQQDVFRAHERDLVPVLMQDNEGDFMIRHGCFIRGTVFSDQNLENDLRYLDGVVGISTRGVFAVSPGRNPLIISQDLFEGIQITTEYPSAVTDNLIAAELSPDKLAIASLVPEIAPGVGGLYVQPVLGDLEPVLLEPTDNALDLRYTRQRTIVLRTETQLRILNPYEPIEPRIAQVTEEIPFDDMDVFDDTDELCLYSSAEGIVRRRDARTLAPIGDWLLPVGAPDRPERVRINPADGSIWAMSGGQLFRLVNVGEPQLIIEDVELPFEVACFSFDERGHVYLGEGDPDFMLIHQFETLGNRLREVLDGPFNQIEVPGCFEITRGRANVDWDLQFRPGSYNVPGDELPNPDEGEVDPGQFSCPPDVNNDGVLDNGDIGTFISLFLAGNIAADFNGDGILDNGDIGAFIAAFLAGC